jgi:hypothetical protein
VCFDVKLAEKHFWKGFEGNWRTTKIGFGHIGFFWTI